MMRAFMAELGVEVDHGPDHSYELPEAPQDVSRPVPVEFTGNLQVTFESRDIQVRGTVRGEIQHGSWYVKDIVVMLNVGV